jgi:1-deoxy-D-xylulose-5-phosphate reductoisomerase
MGRKITVDSATMANKGLELFEAHWLFGLEAARLEVVLHPQSIAHSFVQFVDGSILGQFSPPSMTFAIQHCLLYPDRAPGVEPTLDFQQAMQWDFSAPDFARYPCLRLAYEALQAGGSAPAVYNAANEIAVARFLDGAIGYVDIPRVIDFALNQGQTIAPNSVEALLAIDAATRAVARNFNPTQTSNGASL